VSRNISVNTLTRLRAARPGFDSRQEQWRDFFALPRPDQLWRTQSPIQWVPGGGVFPGSKAAGAWNWPFTSI